MSLQLTQVLNTEQAKAAGTLDGPILIIAGAGSGKTRMITYRIAYMLEQGIPQSNILALTFTNKAAGEMSERIHTITGKKLTKLTTSTFHAFGLSVLRKEGEKIGYQQNFTIYDQADALAMIKTSLQELKIDVKSVDLYSLSMLFSDIKTGRKSFTSDTAQFKPIYHEYISHLKLYNAVDFDDLIVQPLNLFHEYPEILEKYRERFTNILVDEFQDTSMQQYQLIQLLAEKHRNICVVGDDDQSIYSWRGADYRNIANFERDFPECIEIKLEQNYRSTGTILNAANTLITHNRKRKKKRLWTGDEESKGVISLTHPADELEEAEFITEKIREVLTRQSLRYDQFGILVRTNGLLTQLERACLAANIPYKVSGGQSFFQRKEIKDIISYLRVLANPDDDMSLLRIINTPRRGIGKTSLQLLRSTAETKKCSLYSVMNLIAQTDEIPVKEHLRINVTDFMEKMELFREDLFRNKNNISSVVETLVGEINYKSHLITEHPDNERLMRWKLDNIILFINIIKDWEQDPDNFSNRSLFDFLNSISLKGKTEPDQERGKVNLMTIHAAKGLEFHTVFLAGVEDHIIPHKRSIEENMDNIEEERRLFYVAITRAMVNLFMTCCTSRTVMREVIEPVPSRFLSELPKGIYSNELPEGKTEEETAAEFFANMRAMFDKSK